MSRNTPPDDPAHPVADMVQSVDALGANTGRLFGRLYSTLRRQQHGLARQSVGRQRQDGARPAEGRVAGRAQRVRPPTFWGKRPDPDRLPFSRRADHALRPRPARRPVAPTTRRRARHRAGRGPAGRAVGTGRSEAEETEGGTRRAVAGFDFTFSAPKSVSALWAGADAGTQALIADAHHAAVAELVAFLEREVAVTRTGADGPEGTVAHVDVLGVAATAFDHYDSRAGDPQLHTHVVISNKVKTAQDGKWRALAGRPMHAAAVAVSELYNAALADQLTRTLGIPFFGPAAGEVQPVGLPDLVATLIEVALIGHLLVLLTRFGELEQQALLE